jgi:hypothetical protein
MTKKLLSTLCLFTLSIVTFAQLGVSKKAHVDEVKNRTLLVVQEEANPELLKKLTEEQVQFYEEQIKIYNDLIKEVLPKYWYFSEAVEFISRSELNKLVKSKSTDHAYLEWSKFRIHFANKMSVEATRNLQKGGIQLFGSDYIESSLDLRLCDANPLGIPVYGVYLPSPFSNKAELIYGLKQMQLQLTYKFDNKKDTEINNMYKTNAKEMPNKTLLVNRNASNINESDISKHYKYTIQLTDQNKIEEALINEDENMVVVIFIPRAGGKVYPNMVEAKSGREMMRSLPDWNSGVGISTAGIDKLKDDVNRGKLRKDDYKIMSKQID